MDKDLEEMHALLARRDGLMLEQASFVGGLTQDSELEKAIERVAKDLSTKFQWL